MAENLTTDQKTWKDANNHHSANHYVIPPT